MMARITWDPSRYEGKLEHRITRCSTTLPESQRLLRARLVACLAGGLYQDGSVDPERTTPYARQALELAGELEDTLTAAEVLSHARKALIDVDLPEVQLERVALDHGAGQGVRLLPQPRACWPPSSTCCCSHRVDEARA
jgi:hypothetical protein